MKALIALGLLLPRCADPFVRLYTRLSERITGQAMRVGCRSERSFARVACV